MPGDVGREIRTPWREYHSSFAEGSAEEMVSMAVIMSSLVRIGIVTNAVPVGDTSRKYASFSTASLLNLS